MGKGFCAICSRDLTNLMMTQLFCHRCKKMLTNAPKNRADTTAEIYRLAKELLITNNLILEKIKGIERKSKLLIHLEIKAEKIMPTIKKMNTSYIQKEKKNAHKAVQEAPSDH